jgi:hypothetical protein
MGKAWHALLGNVIYGGFALILFLEVAGLEVPEEKDALLYSSPISIRSWSGFIAARGPVSRWLIA